MFSITSNCQNYYWALKNATIDVQLREINERLAGMDSRIANYFMAMMRAIADEAKAWSTSVYVPFTRSRAFTKTTFSHVRWKLQLWCEAEGCQHPVVELGKGVYSIDQPHEWVTTDRALCKFCAGCA